MNAKTGKEWTSAEIEELVSINAFSTTKAYKYIMDFIRKRIDKNDKLSDIRTDIDFAEETIRRRAKHEAYNEIKNYVTNRQKEYNVYEKIKAEANNG